MAEEQGKLGKDASVETVTIGDIGKFWNVFLIKISEVN